MVVDERLAAVCMRILLVKHSSRCSVFALQRAKTKWLLSVQALWRLTGLPPNAAPEIVEKPVEYW